jgi:hypothetical protein
MLKATVMSTAIQPSTPEGAKTDSVVTLLAELTQRLSEQSRWVQQSRLIYSLSILFVLTNVSLIFVLILLPIGFAPPEMNKFVPTLKDIYNSLPFILYQCALLAAATSISYLLVIRVKNLFPTGVRSHAYREVANTYRLSRRVLAEANVMYEHNNLEEHQRILLEVRMGALDAAVALYESVVAPYIRKYIPEDLPQGTSVRQ